MQVETLSAITLATHDITRSLAFYEVLGFRRVQAAPDNSFVTLNAGTAWLNLFRSGPGASWRGWGRYILHVDDVDACYAKLIEAGYHPEMAPSDASWGERYFHVLDPDGHEVSLAKRLPPVGPTDQAAS
jgi:catechol 2,3-dioxygenase-like lactoylglutathione lyase family enzyme